MDLTDDAPAVACVRCRKQKLRCSRERPVCQRCHRAGKQCSYPHPPDRKRLALERALEKSSSAAVQQPSPILEDSGSCSTPYPHPERTLPVAASEHGPASSGRPEPEPESARRVSLCDASPIHVSAEVALYLFEIYFERHYQADLLFRKRQFITSYQGGASCPYVVLAVLAFASIFLPSTPGGMSHGKIDILDLSIADWKAISQQWAEKAGGQALGRADRPCLEVVQACQVLAMFWFAKGETKRTNVHTAIAYRASRLLHLDDASKTAWSAHKELGLGCFWACWLTRCTSQENSRFPGDCWADVAGRPLPVGADDVAANSRALYLDEKGGIIYPDRESAVGFSSVLIVVQGLWWEVQNFGRSIYGSRGTPADWTLQYCILDKKLEDLNLQLPGWDWGSASRGTTSPSAEEPSRMFSLGYLYELCNLYLHSSVVPVFSCLGQTRILSQPMLQLAAERAWEHSLKLTTMTEQYLARQSPISKLWPMIGYGAYVCAAVQLRRCLALRLLDEQRLGRARVHLQFTGGLMRYWTTLRPLHEDMERQFAQTQVLSHTLQATAPASVPVRAGDGQSPFDTRDPAFSTELTSSIQTYVADEDVVESSRAASEPRGEYSEMVTPRELPQRIAGPGDPPWAGAQAQPPPAQVWWNQDSGSLGEAFGSGSFWPEDLGFLMDIA